MWVADTDDVMETIRFRTRPVSPHHFIKSLRVHDTNLSRYTKLVQISPLRLILIIGCLLTRHLYRLVVL